MRDKRPTENRRTDDRKPFRKTKDFRKKPDRSPGKAEDTGLIRLNKYIANAGVCSRREADKLITAGAVTVNGKVVTELGTKISPTDKVSYGDQPLKRERHRYVLLNKPKGFITTTDDPQERKTVMSLIANACKERIYPVGRLDRNTTGVLLFTNDGDLAKKLIHPKHRIEKIYHVVLDRSLTKRDLDKIREGIELDDGLIKVDDIEYIGEGKDKKQIGLKIHSGKNRIVRRIFEKLEYKLIRLDRVSFAGLTKKNLPRGTWRILEEKEVSFLKMLK
jgi:23S rRNA pseudouridine2605 synthase